MLHFEQSDFNASKILQQGFQDSLPRSDERSKFCTFLEQGPQKRFKHAFKPFVSGAVIFQSNGLPALSRKGSIKVIGKLRSDARIVEFHCV